MKIIYVLHHAYFVIMPMSTCPKKKKDKKKSHKKREQNDQTKPSQTPAVLDTVIEQLGQACLARITEQAAQTHLAKIAAGAIAAAASGKDMKLSGHDRPKSLKEAYEQIDQGKAHAGRTVVAGAGPATKKQVNWDNSY